jgi:hypothetical protein
MIESYLGELDATIYAYEPDVSRSVDTTEVRHALSELEFDQVDLADVGSPGQRVDSEARESHLLTAFVKGNVHLLRRRWVALMISQNPGEREWAALDSIAAEMSGQSERSIVALVHGTQWTSRVARLFVQHGNAVVIVLPFGPLNPEIHRIGLEMLSPHDVAVISMERVRAPWTKAGLRSSISFVEDGADSILFTDPQWHRHDHAGDADIATKPIFYVAYGSNDRPKSRALAAARPVGKRADSGRPNLSALFASPSLAARSHVESKNSR